MSANGHEASRRERVEQLKQHGHEIHEGSQAVASGARGAVREAAEIARSELESHPYRTLGLMLGTGLVLGGGVPLRALTFTAGLGARLALASAVREVTTGLAAPLGDGTTAHAPDDQGHESELRH